MRNAKSYFPPVRHGTLLLCRVALWVVLGVLLFGPMQGQAYQIAGLQGDTLAEQGKELLQKRVIEFYNLLQTRQIIRAERYATNDSRELLRDQASSTFLGFKVTSIKISPEGTFAEVDVEMTVMAPFATAPVPVQRHTQWRVEEGEWRIIVPEPPMSGSEDMLALNVLEKAKPEELTFDGHAFGLGVMKPGEVKEARYPFKNNTDHVVTIKEITADCECLKARTEKDQFQPGEQGEVIVTFDSTDYEYAYMDTVVVTTSPGDIKSYLRIGAHVIPRAIAFPEKQTDSAQQ